VSVSDYDANPGQIFPPVTEFHSLQVKRVEMFFGVHKRGRAAKAGSGVRMQTTINEAWLKFRITAAPKEEPLPPTKSSINLQHEIAPAVTAGALSLD
jgi:hypothetical protein